MTPDRFHAECSEGELKAFAPAKRQQIESVSGFRLGDLIYTIEDGRAKLSWPIIGRSLQSE
jgi:hypothetical protein